jgi:hypothetical protein
MACMDRNYVDVKIGDTIAPPTGSNAAVAAVGHFLIKDVNGKVWRAKECVKQ